MNKYHISGISNTSTIFFYTPDNCLPDFFYYPLCIGHYFCNASYKVTRNQYDSFLFLYTKNGKGMISIGNKQTELYPGELCLIDCYHPHAYWAIDEWEFIWIHVDGGNSRAYFDYLTDKHYFKIQAASQSYGLLFEQSWAKIHQAFLEQKALQAPIISQNIQELFTVLALAKETQQNLSHSDFIDDTLKYIRRHLTQPLTLKHLADRVSLSQYYFSRKFKEKTGYTPYDYILTSRLNLARYYLKTSQDSIKTIGYQCGFQSEHSFCTAFKNATGITPTEFRKS